MFDVKLNIIIRTALYKALIACGLMLNLTKNYVKVY